MSGHHKQSGRESGGLATARATWPTLTALAAVAALICIIVAIAVTSGAGNETSAGSPQSAPAEPAPSDGDPTESLELQPFDESGERVGDTELNPAPAPGPDAPPDPLDSSARDRSEYFVLPERFTAQWPTELESWTKTDTAGRGFESTHATTFSLDPGPGVLPAEMDGALLVEAGTDFVGDESDFRDAMINGEDEFYEVTEVEVGGAPAALSSPRDQVGPVRVDAAVNGELISVVTVRLQTEDGEVVGLTDEETVTVANEYVEALYGGTK